MTMMLISQEPRPLVISQALANRDMSSCSSAFTMDQTIVSSGARRVNVFHTPARPQLADLVVVLPFGLRHQAAQRLYTALATSFNVLTWESSFVLDFDETPDDMSIEIEDHVLDLACVIEHAQIWRDDACRGVSVLGYCSGAGIAMLGAARYPDRIRRLALVSGEYVLPTTVCKRTSFQREVDFILPAAAVSRERARSLFEKIAVGHKAPTTEFHDFVSTPFSSPEHLYRFGLNYLAYRNVDFQDLATCVHQPSAVLAARGDEQVTLESSRIISRQLPNKCDFVTFEGDHYELCRANGDIIDFLAAFFAARNS